jgi:hypothetical protein
VLKIKHLKVTLKHFIIFLPIVLICCKKDSREGFYKSKNNSNFVIWKDVETVSQKDFGIQKSWGHSRPFIKIMTGIDSNKNELLYFVYLDRDKSRLNISKPKDSIDNVLLYTNLKMDCYEITARKYVQKFERNKNMNIVSTNYSKYITNEIVAQTELELDKLTERIWYSKFNKDTISKIKLELKERLR